VQVGNAEGREKRKEKLAVKQCFMHCNDLGKMGKKQRNWFLSVVLQKTKTGA